MATVNEKMTAIADNIRSKTGKTEPLTLDGMASGVNEVYETGKENALTPIRESLINKGEKLSESANVEEVTECLNEAILLSELCDFSFFFSEDRRHDLISKLKYKTTSGSTDFYQMFCYSNLIETIPQIDLGNGLRFVEMFDSCLGLKTIPQLNTSNGTNFSRMFCGCGELITISQIDVSNASNSRSFSEMFFNCTNLQNITFAGTIKASGLNFGTCPNLTHDSLMSLINALADKSGNASTTWKVTIGNTNIAKLTEEELKIASDKNWEVV